MRSTSTSTALRSEAAASRDHAGGHAVGGVDLARAGGRSVGRGLRLGAAVASPARSQEGRERQHDERGEVAGRPGQGHAAVLGPDGRPVNGARVSRRPS